MKQQLNNPQFAKKAIVLAMAGAFAAPAGAQQGIDEIIVTATKRSENIQDVGLSITAIDAAGLEAAGITDVSRLNLMVAGLNYSHNGNDGKFALRGATSQNTYSDNSASVGVFIDGVYKPSASMITHAFFDIERLEFLKGPQGTLYGRNTFAGALNIYTAKPNFDGYDGYITASFESFNTQRTSGAINLPFNDKFAVRVAGFYENGDGWIENTAGPDLGAPNDWGMRLTALWAPTDDLDVTLRAQNIEENGTSVGSFGVQLGCRRVDAQGLTDAFGAIEDCSNSYDGSVGGGGGGGGDEYTVSQDFAPNNDNYDRSISADINWDAGPVTVKSITAYSDFEQRTAYDGDFSANPYYRNGFDDYTESWSQEIVISSNYDSAVQWTAGAYYAEDESFYSFWQYSHTVNAGGQPIIDNTPLGDGVTLIVGTPIVSTATSLLANYADLLYVDNKITGTFAEVEISVMDNLRLIAGLRYSTEDKTSNGGSNFHGPSYSGIGVVEFNFPAGAAPVNIPSTRQEAYTMFENGANNSRGAKDFSNTTWKAAMEYDFSDDVMLYATAATGFLSGAGNTLANFTDEQESESYEIGVKSILMDGTLLLNVAGYYVEYTNLITQIQVAVGNAVRTDTVNEGDVDSTGIDIEVQYRPTDALTLAAVFAFQDATFGVFGQTSGNQLIRGVPSVSQSVTGESPGWNPEVTFNFTAAYEAILGNQSTLTPAIQFYYSDEYSTGNQYVLDPSHQQDSYTKTDLRLTWRSANGDYSVAAYIQNIEDDAIRSRGTTDNRDVVQTGYLYPQNIGVSFSVNFD